jgi:integrase
MSGIDLRLPSASARQCRAGAPSAESGDGRARGAAGAALIVSKWAGHYDAAFTQRTYVHASTEDLPYQISSHLALTCSYPNQVKAVRE